MKHGHLTEQRKHFVEAYCRLGNGTLAAKEAGYKDSPSLVNQASKLKRELSAEISEESSLTAARLRVRNYFQEKHGSPELILVESGIGKVNFAVASTVLIQHLSCELLIFSGVAD